MAKFFSKIFSGGGDKTIVPDNVQSDGSVSYDQGYGPDYERPKTDPLSKNIERPKQNQLFNDITSAIKEWQTQGYPAWITSADNSGTPFSYAAGAVVRYTDGKTYQARKNTSALPTSIDDWTPLDVQFTLNANGGSFKMGPLTLKWGTATVANTGTRSDVVFPEPFPVACFNIQVIHVGQVPSVNIIIDNSPLPARTGFGARTDYMAEPVLIYYFAVGV